MKVYSPSKTATLRKYSLLLESNGYEIERNSKRHRYYRDKDVMIGASKGATLEESIRNVINLKHDNSETNETDNGKVANKSDMEELKEMVHKQNQLIQSLVDKLDEQQEYINKQIDLKLNESNEEVKQIGAPKEDVPVENKKGFFARIFNR